MTARGGPFPTMSTPLSQVSLKPAGMIRLCLSARWWNSAMPCPRRTAVLWPPALHSAVHLPREALRSCYCSIPIGLSAARLLKRLLRSPPRYRRRRFGAWSQCAIGGPRRSEPKSTASFVRRARPASIARNGKRVVPKRFSLLPSMVPQLRDSCWCRLPAEKKRISSILTKGGVADAWSGEPESPRRIEAALVDSGMDAPMLAVSRSYLDRVLSHQLALSVERGAAAPLGLLQVAETLGGVDWQPARMDFDETLARLITEIPEAMRGGTAVETVLRKSGELADLKVVAQSWFEDGPDIAQAIAGARAPNRAKVATYLLQSVIARHRDKWADLLLRTALWMREAPLELNLCWRELAIVAKALADGRDMAEIGLMRDIAQRTLAVLANDRRR